MNIQSRIGASRHCKQLLKHGACFLMVMCRVGSSQAAGVDCAKAASRAEHVICTNPQLFELDRNLAIAYSGATAATDNPTRLRAEQREWLKMRDGCLLQSTECTDAEKIYQDRIEQLRMMFSKPAADAGKRQAIVASDRNPLVSKLPSSAVSLCAILKTVEIPNWGPDRALMSLSKFVEPILDESFKARVPLPNRLQDLKTLPLPEPLIFDIDNSGTLKKVVIVSWSSHASESETYLAYNDEAWEAARTASFEGALEGKNATIVFPDAWEDCKAWSAQMERDRIVPPVPSCPNQDANLPFKTGRVHWRAQYLHLAPFRYQSTTYFLATTEDHDRYLTAFVIKPMPNSHYELTCKLATNSPQF